jgi:hypothetical protein
MEMLQQQSSDRDKFQQQMAEQLVEIQKLCSAQFASFEIARREVSFAVSLSDLSLHGTDV